MFQFDNRIIWIILGGLLLFGLSSLLTNPERLLELVLTIPGVLIAITFHEFAHAVAADKLGDDTPRMQGRLTLNPLHHLDPIGSILLLTAGFGWGKPVQINPRNFDRRISMTAGEAIVSFAGPLTNFILAILFLIILYTINVTNIITNYEILYILNLVLRDTVIINIGLGIFNLIPLPPLDGSKILTHFLPYNARQWFINNQMIFYMIFMIIWITNLSSVILNPLFSATFDGMNFLVSKMFGINLFIM